MDAKHEQNLNDGAVHVRSIGDSTELKQLEGNDEDVLKALGYKQEFKRDFSMWTCLGVSFSILGVMPSVAATLTYNFGYSGPAGSVWSWIVAGIPIQFVALSIAELCSSMPTAGGMYFASSVLAPEGWGPLCSWITGWSNFCGWIVGPGAVNYVLASMILTAGEISNPGFVMQTYQIYLLMVLLLVVQALITMNSTKVLAHFNVISSIANTIVILLFVFWMPFGSVNTPKTNPNDIVWTSNGFINGTEWPIGFSCIMGMIAVILTLVGFDAPFHLSEECSNADIAAPRAIVMTAQLGWSIGWVVTLVVAYTIQNLGDVVSGEYGQPMGSLCLQVLGTKAGLAMFSLVILTQFLTAQGALVAGSRLIFSLSRDDVLPFSRWTKRVNRHTKTPVNAIWFLVIISALVGLLMFASTIAIYATFSIGGVAQYVAYGVPITLRLFARERFKPGPWNLGRFSKPVSIVAVSWIFIMIPILCFPATKGTDLNPLNMNWASLLYGGVMIFALLWYAIDARKWYKGPKRNLQEYTNGEGEGVMIEGKADSQDGIGEIKKGV